MLPVEEDVSHQNLSLSYTFCQWKEFLSRYCRDSSKTLQMYAYWRWKSDAAWDRERLGCHKAFALPADGVSIKRKALR